MKDNVLFVDDDQTLLSGLQRMLRTLRGDWDMTFINSPESSLQAIRDNDFDVIVTDMRMPGLDGAQLLQEVQKESPETVRIILSGQADLDTIFRALKHTHLYISKPCSADDLRQIVGRACSLRRLLTSVPLKRLASQIDSLPFCDINYQKFCDELREKNSKIEVVAEIVAADISLSAKILQMVNSSFFGARSISIKPQEAVSILGLDLLREITFNTTILQAAISWPGGQEELANLNSHSIMVSNFARKIARVEGLSQELVDLCAVGGLLHDIGKIVLGIYSPQEFLKFDQLDSGSQQEAPSDAERQRTTHAVVGAYLLALWGLPDEVVRTVLWHHKPSGYLAEELTPWGIVNIADAFAHMTETGCNLALAELLADYTYFEKIKKTSALERWLEACKS